MLNDLIITKLKEIIKLQDINDLYYKWKMKKVISK